MMLPLLWGGGEAMLHLRIHGRLPSRCSLHTARPMTTMHTASVARHTQMTRMADG
jgi:hypothetical protein